MKNKQQIISDLKQLVQDNNLHGAVSDELINILAYYLYENQAAIASGVLESSIDTCTKMNSLIAHAMGYMYNISRPESRKVLLVNEDSMITATYSYHDLIYSSSKFNLIYEDKLVTGSTGVITTRLVGDINEEYFSYTSGAGIDYYKELTSDNISILDIYIMESGSYVPFNNIYYDFSEYYNHITTDLNTPAMFILNTTNYGARVYISSPNSLDIKIVTYKYNDYILSSKDVTNIKAPGILPNNWSNNNISTNYYNSEDLGTPSSPLVVSYSPEQVIYEPGKNILFINTNKVILSDERNNLLLFLGKGFVSNKSDNILELFYKYVYKGSSNKVDASIIDDISNTYDEMSIGAPIYCLVYGDPNQSISTKDDLNAGISAENFLIAHPSYLSYDWALDSSGRWVQDYDFTTDSTTTNILEVHTGVLNIKLRVGGGDYYDSEGNNLGNGESARVQVEGEINSLLNNYYSNRLLKSSGSGYSIYDSTILSIISDYKLDLTSIDMSYSRVNILKNTYTGSELTTTINSTGGVLNIVPSISDITIDGKPFSFIRRSSNYAFIYEVVVEIVL